MAAATYLLRHHLRPHLLVHPAMPLPSPTGGDPPDCVLPLRLPDAFHYGGLKPGLPASFAGPAADKDLAGNRYFREGGEFLLDAGALSSDDRMVPPVFRRLVLVKTVGCLLCRAGGVDDIFSPSTA